MKAGIAVGVVIAIVALVVCLVPLKEVAYTMTVDYQDVETYYETEPYQDTETYYVDEPYEDTETYYVDEPYEDTETYTEAVPATYKAVKSYTDTDSEKIWRGVSGDVEVFYPIGCVTLQNTDSDYGKFGIQFTFYMLEKFRAETLAIATLRTKEELIKTHGKKYYGKRSLTLEPGETRTITCSVLQDIGIDATDRIIGDMLLWDWKYTITEATKTVEKQRTVTKYREIEKERTVTKYRQVEKQRTVTKYRQVEKERTVMKQRLETRYKKVTLLDYFLHY